MTKVGSELTLNAGQLSETAKPISSDLSFQSTRAAPRPLPKPLTDLKTYVDSKFCYHSAALNTAELVNVQEKIAYRCHMKVLLEKREVKWKKEPATWNHEKVLHSTTLGRLLEDTTRGGQSVGDIWNDYDIEIPASDKSETSRALPQCNYLSRCGNCRGKGLVTCSASGCYGSGWVRCSSCGGLGRTETSTTVTICSCRGGQVRCSSCGGDGKVRCSKCKGGGGFYHSAKLLVRWFTSSTTCYYQNSFLPKKKIAKAKRNLFWTNTQELWSKESSIQQFLYYLYQDEANEGIPLKGDVLKQYNEKHLQPTVGVNNKMRRLTCTIERLDFEEVRYTLDKKYVNKRDSSLGNHFRFCQFPVHGKGLMIYENDYPLNCCGCFGERCACYSCCCTIL